MKFLYVYILECSDKSYYTGVTNDPDRRVIEHRMGNDRDSYTYSRRPLKCVFVSDGMLPDDAIEFEKQVKSWRRDKKQALIKDEWERLPELSINYKKRRNQNTSGANGSTGSP